MNPILERLKTTLDRLNPRQRVQLGLTLVATMGLVWGFAHFANQVRYGVLFSNLSRDDAAPVIAMLKERNVDYRLAAGGGMIEVPFEDVDELRLELAGEGLPRGGGVGFELFDKPSFGLSDFVQNVNYRRALERELARTIQSVDSVSSARVHLALPPESVFAEEQRKASASVVVRLHAGRQLANDRVRAVQYMVASGVEGLDPGEVSVIDGEGRMLSSGAEDGQSMLSSNQQEARRSMERNIEDTLLSILEPIVGVGKVKTRATVELSMTRVQRVEETYDPAGAVVRSEVKQKRNKTGAGNGNGNGSGIPGTATNLPGGNATAGTSPGEGEESSSSTTNFEINKSVATISEPVGSLARQSIAVVLDNASVVQTSDQGETTTESTPRTAEELDKITELVQAAIGFNERRGDQLMVRNIPFEEPTLEGTDAGGSWLDLLPTILRFASLPLAVLFLALLVFRPAIAAVRGLKSSEATGDGEGHMPPTVAQLQARIAGQLPGGEGGSNLRTRLMEAVAEDPETAALVVRNWMDRPAAAREKSAT